MTEPNIVNVTSIKGRSYLQLLKDDAITHTNADMLEADTNTLIKINSVIIASIDASNACTVDVAVNHHDHGRHYIAYQIDLPAKSTLIVIGKDSPIYLEEGDMLEARASADSDADICISFEILDDA